jgi:hypothetical protein
MKAIIKQNIDICPDIKKDDIVKFKFDYDNSEFIYPLVDNIPFFINDVNSIKETQDRMEYYNKNFTSNKRDILSLDGREIFGTFEGFSRIDGKPMIIIHDIIIEERNSKLSNILLN